MNDVRLLKFGPEPMYRATRGGAYIAISDEGIRKQIGSDMLVGAAHDSLASFGAEVERIRRDLDDALREATEYFASHAHR